MVSAPTPKRGGERAAQDPPAPPRRNRTASSEVPGALRAPPEPRAGGGSAPKEQLCRYPGGTESRAPNAASRAAVRAWRTRPQLRPWPAGLGHPSSPKLGLGLRRHRLQPSGPSPAPAAVVAGLRPRAARRGAHSTCCCRRLCHCEHTGCSPGVPPSRRPTLGSSAAEHALPGGRRLRRRGLGKVGGGWRAALGAGSPSPQLCAPASRRELEASLARRPGFGEVVSGGSGTF